MDILDHAEDYAADLEGNWLHWRNFHWRRDCRPDDAERFAIVETHNRDSGLTAQSNAAAIAKALEPFAEGDDPDVLEHSANCWAHGWREGHAVRVRGADGEITAAFVDLVELLICIETDVIIDSSDLSEREVEAAIDAIGLRSNLAKDNPPDDWAERVWAWLWDNDQGELENRDGTGAWPSDEAIATALMALGLDDAEECADALGLDD